MLLRGAGCGEAAEKLMVKRRTPELFPVDGAAPPGGTTGGHSDRAWLLGAENSLARGHGRAPIETRVSGTMRPAFMRGGDTHARDPQSSEPPGGRRLPQRSPHIQTAPWGGLCGGQHLRMCSLWTHTLVGALHPDSQVVGILSATFTARNGRR